MLTKQVNAKLDVNFAVSKSIIWYGKLNYDITKPLPWGGGGRGVGAILMIFLFQILGIIEIEVEKEIIASVLA